MGISIIVLTSCESSFVRATLSVRSYYLSFRFVLVLPGKTNKKMVRNSRFYEYKVQFNKEAYSGCCSVETVSFQSVARFNAVTFSYPVFL